MEILTKTAITIMVEIQTKMEMETQIKMGILIQEIIVQATMREKLIIEKMMKK